MPVLLSVTVPPVAPMGRDRETHGSLDQFRPQAWFKVIQMVPPAGSGSGIKSPF